MPAMLGCSTSCPNCKHQFQCCPPSLPQCCAAGRRLQVLSGGGLVVPTSATVSPQLSPQVVTPHGQISFVIPVPIQLLVAPPAPSPPHNYAEVRSETDLERITATVRALNRSGWYYETLSLQRSDELLKNTKVGTFLVRNSSDPRYLFTLSVQTERGPRSVRLFYQYGRFRLDAQERIKSQLPSFPGVLELVEFYVNRGKPSTAEGDPVWVDTHGNLTMSIYLSAPLRKAAPSLKQLARLAIHKSLHQRDARKITRLDLPKSLASYLEEYPFSL